MTKEETKQFNIRIATSLYDEIKEEADKQEITMTEYVISKLTDNRPRIDDSYIEQLKARIEQQAEAIRIKEENIQQLADDSNDVDDSYKERYIEQLDKQIEQQGQAIQDKENHIQELTRLLDQQQQLTLKAQADKETLQIELKEDTNKWWKFWKE